MKMGGSMNRHAGDWGSISRTAWIRPSVMKASASVWPSFSNPRRVTSPPLSGRNVKVTNHLSLVGKHMRYLLIYDITEDRARTRVADLCLDYGLERIQYSAFWGDLPRTLQEELLLKIRRVLQGKTADVRLIPLCERDLARTKQLTFSEKRAARAS